MGKTVEDFEKEIEEDIEKEVEKGKTKFLRIWLLSL
jgi:hypothetical protein